MFPPRQSPADARFYGTIFFQFFFFLLVLLLMITIKCYNAVVYNRINNIIGGFVVSQILSQYVCVNNALYVSFWSRRFRRGDRSDVTMTFGWSRIVPYLVQCKFREKVKKIIWNIFGNAHEIKLKIHCLSKYILNGKYRMFDISCSKIINVWTTF